GNPTPTTPLITITPPNGAPQIILKPQDLLGPGKRPQHIDSPTLASLSVGEDPRAIGDNSATPAPPTVAANGTQASGAVDVVRIKLLVPDPTSHLADVRIGHMEAKAQVPSGGVSCPTSTPTTNPTATTTPGTPTTNTTATTTPGGGGTTTTTNNVPGNTTTTQPGGGGGTTTTAPNAGGNTTTTAQPAAATTTTRPAQVQAVTFSQTPTAQAQSQTPN